MLLGLGGVIVKEGTTLGCVGLAIEVQSSHRLCKEILTTEATYLFTNEGLQDTICR